MGVLRLFYAQGVRFLMAFTNHSFANYEVAVPLSFEYSRETVHPAGGDYGDLPQYRYTRRATKTYRYKGMTEAALKACLAAKRRQYCRRFMAWTLVGGNWISPYELDNYSSIHGGLEAPAIAAPDYFEQVASFSVSRDVVVYHLEIAVDETVVMYHSQEYDPNTEAGIAALEARFVNTQAPVSYIAYKSPYGYDERTTA